MKNITVVTGIWQRPEIFEIWAKCYKQIQEVLDVNVIVAGSEGLKTQSIVEGHGFTYVEHSNDNLSAKMNATLKKAAEINSDFVFCVGSDDLFTVEAMDFYINNVETKNIDFMGCKDFYFYDTISKKALYWEGYGVRRQHETCGAGRMLSARLLDEWNWEIWESRHNKVLDTSMQIKLNNTPHRSCIFSLRDWKKQNVYGLDLKSRTNMTKFARWENSYYIDISEIKTAFPYVWDSNSDK